MSADGAMNTSAIEQIDDALKTEAISRIRLTFAMVHWRRTRIS